MTPFLQVGEIQAVEKLYARLTDAGILGIATGLILIMLLGGLYLLMQQRNFSKQAVATNQATEKLTELFAGLLRSISDRLQDAQDTKGVLTIVTQNQAAIIRTQDDHSAVLTAIPELVTLVNEALTLLHTTVDGFRAIAIETSRETLAGFEVVGKRFDTVDMRNGEILEELKKLNKTIQSWIDRQEIGDASQAKAQRKLNEELLATLKLIQIAVERGNVAPDPKQDSQ